MEEQRKVAPPVQIEVPKGGVAFRELRVWHRCVEILLELLIGFVGTEQSDHSETWSP